MMIMMLIITSLYTNKLSYNYDDNHAYTERDDYDDDASSLMMILWMPTIFLKSSGLG